MRMDFFEGLFKAIKRPCLVKAFLKKLNRPDKLLFKGLSIHGFLNFLISEMLKLHNGARPNSIVSREKPRQQ